MMSQHKEGFRYGGTAIRTVAGYETGQSNVSVKPAVHCGTAVRPIEL